MSRSIAACLMCSLVLAACADSTEPPDGFRGVYARQVRGTAGIPYGVRISPSGMGYVLQLSATTASRFDMGGSSVLSAVILGTDPFDVAFTASGDLGYFSMYDGTRVYEVNAVTGAVLDSVTFGSRHNRILMHPDDSKYWVTSIDGRIWSVDRASGARTDSALFPGRNLRGISRRSTDGTLAVSAGRTMLLLDGNTLDSIAAVDLQGEVQDVAHMPDGSRILVAVEGRGVLALDYASLSVIDAADFEGTDFGGFGLAVSPDGSTVVASSSMHPLVAIIDPQTLEVRRLFASGGTPRRVAFSPDSKFAFIANQSGWIDVLK